MMVSELKSGIASKHASLAIIELSKDGPYMFNLVSKLYDPVTSPAWVVGRVGEEEVEGGNGGDEERVK